MRKLFLLISLLLIIPLFAGTVVVVTWSEKGPYKIMTDAIIDSLPDDDIIIINMYENPKKLKGVVKRISSEMPNVVVLLGREVVEYVAPKIIPYPTIYALSPVPSSKVTSISSVKGVPETVPLNIQLSYIKQMFPSLKTVGVIFDQKTALEYAKALKKVGDEKNVNMDFIGINGEKDIETAMHLASIDGFIWPIYTSFIQKDKIRKKIISLSIEKKVPLYGFNEEDVKRGALFTLLPDYQKHAELMISMVKAVLSDTDIEKIPNAYGKKCTPYINLSTAGRIGVKIPDEILKDSKVIK